MSVTIKTEGRSPSATENPLKMVQLSRFLRLPPAKNASLLVLTKSLSYGGVEKAVATLVEELQAREYSVHLGLLEHTILFPHSVSAGLIVPPIFLKAVDRLPYFLAHPLRVLSYIILIQLYILKFRPSRILTTCTHSHMATSFVWRFGAQWLSWIGSDLSDGIDRSSDSPLARKIVRRFFSWVYRKPIRTAVPTSGLKTELERELDLSGPKISVIANPFRAFQLERTPNLPNDHEGSLLVSVGRLEAVKGFDLLLRALQSLDDTQLCLVGDGPERGRLEALARSLQIEERVRFVGWVDEPQVFMMQADIVVVSSHREGFSYVLLEALSLGCCVVTSDCAHGPKEIVGESDCAVFFPSGDWSALSEILRELLNDDNRRALLRERGRERAKAFSLQKTMDNFCNFLDC